MNRVLVDSNIFLDIIKRDPLWEHWSASTLGGLAETSVLAINPIIFAEVSMGFATPDECGQFVSPVSFLYAPLPYKAAFLAGKAFLAYRQSGGQRRSPLPDFYIGAHAAIDNMALLTRDPTRYRNYFPSVRLICPDAH